MLVLTTVRRPVCLTLVLALGLLAVHGCGGGTEPDDNAPTILLLNPAGVPTGATDFPLGVYGKGFAAGAEIEWNGQPRQTFVASASVLYATITAADVGTAGTARVTVRLADGSTSPGATFRIGQALEPPITFGALDPDHAAAGSDTTTVTVSGSGFVEGTVLLLDGEVMPTVLVSSSSLRATVRADLLTVNQTITAQLAVPGFWSSSTTIPWEVRAEPPQLVSLDPAAVGAGSADLPLRVHGSAFAGNSVILVNGLERTTTFLDGTELLTVLPEADLAGPSTLSISVRTPAPGGGTSTALDLAVTNEPPVLAPLPLAGVTAGRPGMTLVVQGQHFTPGTKVQWNGSDRPTVYRSGRRLFATIPAADIAAPGTAAVTVVKPGFPGTQPRTLTIHPVPSATITSVKTLALPGQWLATDPVTGKLYATIAGSGGQHGNTVAEIDPLTPAVATSVFVGSEPGAVEVSDDGTVLWVGIDGAQAVRQVSLPGLVPGGQFAVGQGLVAGELHVMPGAPHTVAVERIGLGFSPSDAGVFVYDDGVARPQNGSAATTFGWSADGTALFGFNNETTGFEMQGFTVGSDGVRQAWLKGGLIESFYVRIQVVGDQIYGGEGSVVDGDLRERLGTCSMFGWVAVDRALGRAFYWSDDRIEVCDLATYQSLGTLTVPVTSFPHPASRHNLVRWGSDGLAFSDGETIYLVRTPLASP